MLTATLLSLASTGSAARNVPAAHNACPAQHAGVPLSRATIYDGPLSDNASLAPDSTRTVRGVTTQHWRVDYVYEAGRRINLSCEYKGQRNIVVPIHASTRLCTYVWGRTTTRMSCA